MFDTFGTVEPDLIRDMGQGRGAAASLEDRSKEDLPFAVAGTTGMTIGIVGQFDGRVSCNDPAVMPDMRSQALEGGTDGLRLVPIVVRIGQAFQEADGFVVECKVESLHDGHQPSFNLSSCASGPR